MKRDRDNRGLVLISIALPLFVGAWVARGLIEKKTPSTFEVGFAVLTVCALYVDPKKSGELGKGAIVRLLGVQQGSDEIAPENEINDA